MIRITIDISRSASVERPTLHEIEIANIDPEPNAVVALYSARSGDIYCELHHTRSDGAMALVERAIFKLRRRGLR